eukprot:CAMPEP_0116049290 /NCGR_PEP_ID=MMETSP0321-20121206/30087_1 /TAXON_ID=163516 /ORGANISM="Leptocylindrus danicus var. danicus, Strain B650" /LENGTH=205 /DNA_ID=CAMNT_0003531709 /DNA_START=1672 /DNA_END=2289 /DNA_ORIENTATION=-
MTALHGYAAIPSCDRSSNSAIDFVLCSPSLLCWLSILMMDKLSGCTLPSSSMWTWMVYGKLLFNILHNLLSQFDFQGAIQQAQDALAQHAPEPELQQKMNHADEIMTACIVRAEKSVMPSKWALSHPWLPVLVMAQKKKGLLANLLSILGAQNAISPRITRRFHRNAHAIDPTWEVPPLSPSSIQQMAHDATKHASSDPPPGPTP